VRRGSRGGRRGNDSLSLQAASSEEKESIEEESGSAFCACRGSELEREKSPAQRRREGSIGEAPLPREGRPKRKTPLPFLPPRGGNVVELTTGKEVAEKEKREARGSSASIAGVGGKEKELPHYHFLVPLLGEKKRSNRKKRED